MDRCNGNLYTQKSCGNLVEKHHIRSLCCSVKTQPSTFVCLIIYRRFCYAFKPLAFLYYLYLSLHRTQMQRSLSIAFQFSQGWTAFMCSSFLTFSRRNRKITIHNGAVIIPVTLKKEKKNYITPVLFFPPSGLAIKSSISRS